MGQSREPGEQWFPTNETKKMYENTTVPEPYANITMKQALNLLPKFLQHDRSAAKARHYERYRTSEHFQAAMKNYYALVTGVDQACKEIVDRLKKEGLYNNTMIIFTTDHGLFHGRHGLAGKWYPYQESIRTPLIIYDPRMPKEKVGTLDDSLTLNIDLADTILGAAGLEPDERMQGRDISDIYLPNKDTEVHPSASVEEEPWRDEFFYEFPPIEGGIPPSTALVRKEWKYMHWPNHNHEQLFDLKNDPFELNDLYHNSETREILKEMRDTHNKYRKSLYTQYNDTECRAFAYKEL